MRLSQVIHHFRAYGRRRYADRTLAIYLGHLEQFCRYTQDKEVEQVDLFSDVLAYVDGLERRGMSANTINLFMVALRQLWKATFALERQLGIQLPFTADSIPIKRGIIARSHKPVTRPQFERLTASFGDGPPQAGFRGLRDELIIRLLYDTGVRVSELTAIDLEDLDMERCAVRVITRKRKDEARFREVYWTDGTGQALISYLELRTRLSSDTGPLFLNERADHRLTSRSVQRIVRTQCKAAGIGPTKITPHSFRHAVGMRAAQEQMYPPLLQAYLGHCHPASTQVYWNLNNESLRKEYHTKLGDLRTEELLKRLASSSVERGKR